MDYFYDFDYSRFSFGMDTLILIGLIALGIAAFYAFKRLVWKKLVHQNNNFLVQLYHKFNRPLQVIIVLGAVTLLLNNVSEDIRDQIWFQKSYSILVILTIAWMAVRAINLTGDWFAGRYNVSVRDNLKARRIHTQVRVLRRLGISITTLIALASSLMVFDQIRALGVSLIASAGLAGIILGLAAQKTIGNFFTGLQIAITQPVRIGDVVIVENEWGVIEEINLTYVVVKIWDLRRLVLPINYFVDHPFQNWTRTTANLLGTVMLYVDYSLPLEPLRAEFERLLTTEEVREKWDGEVKAIQVTDNNEKAMEVRVLVSAVDASTAFDLRCILRERLIDFIQKNYPQSLPRVRTELPSVSEGQRQVIA